MNVVVQLASHSCLKESREPGAKLCVVCASAVIPGMLNWHVCVLSA